MIKSSSFLEESIELRGINFQYFIYFLRLWVNLIIQFIGPDLLKKILKYAINPVYSFYQNKL